VLGLQHLTNIAVVLVLNRIALVLDNPGFLLELPDNTGLSLGIHFPRRHFPFIIQRKAVWVLSVGF
jgi:hypothetical protein